MSLSWPSTPPAPPKTPESFEGPPAPPMPPTPPSTPAEARASYFATLDPDDELRVRKVADKASIGDDDYLWVVLDGLTKATNLQIASSERIAARIIRVLQNLESQIPRFDIDQTLNALRENIASELANTSGIIVARKIEAVLGSALATMKRDLAATSETHQKAHREATTLLRAAKHAPTAYAVVILIAGIFVGFLLHLL
jgi:hypothetical protein